MGLNLLANRDQRWLGERDLTVFPVGQEKVKTALRFRDWVSLLLQGRASLTPELRPHDPGSKDLESGPQHGA